MLREFIVGGPKVQDARSDIQELGSKPHRSKRQEKDLANARQITRRHFNQLVFVKLPLLAGSAAVLGALGKYGSDNLLTGEDSSEESVDTWRARSASERIKYILEHGFAHKPYPNGLDPVHEQAFAIAQNYCSEVQCRFSSDKIAESVRILDGDNFVNEAIKANKIDPRDIADVKLRQSELQLNGTPDVLVNTYSMQAVVSMYRSKYPGLSERLGADLEAKVYENMFYHAFSHVNASETETSIPQVVLRVRGEEIAISSMHGFKLRGKLKNGEDFFLNGGNEAATELTGLHLTTGASEEISEPRYLGGVQLLRRLNVAAGINEDTFVSEYIGNGAENILDRWREIRKDRPGSNITPALEVYGMIGMYVQGFITQVEAKSVVDQYIAQ